MTKIAVNKRRDDIAEILRLQEAARWQRLPQSENVIDQRAPGEYPPAPAIPLPDQKADPFGLRMDMDRYQLEQELDKISPDLPMPRSDPRRR